MAHPPDKLDLFSLLIQASLDVTAGRHQYTLRDIIAECFSLFIAGNDTTSRTMQFLAIELSSRPDVQSKIYEEIVNIRSKKGDDWEPTYADLGEFSYIDSVLKEIVRMYSVAPFLLREVKTETVIHDIEFKQGQQVLLSLYSYHRNPAEFDSPDDFLPERWDTPGKLNLSFGFDSRMCFGKRQAWMTMKMACYILCKDFVLSEDTEHPSKVIQF